jgi:hypothetical protein
VARGARNATARWLLPAKGAARAAGSGTVGSWVLYPWQRDVRTPPPQRANHEATRGARGTDNQAPHVSTFFHFQKFLKMDFRARKIDIK